MVLYAKEAGHGFDQSPRNQPIADSLASSNPIVRMFAIVDRRVGKRTLHRLRDSLQDQPEWLRPLYEARLVAEGVTF